MWQHQLTGQHLQHLAADTSCHGITGCAPRAFAIVFDDDGSQQVLSLHFLALYIALYTCLRQNGIMWSHISSYHTNMG